MPQLLPPRSPSREVGPLVVTCRPTVRALSLTPTQEQPGRWQEGALCGVLYGQYRGGGAGTEGAQTWVIPGAESPIPSPQMPGLAPTGKPRPP